MYDNVQLFIAGKWRSGSDGASLPVVNPADEEVIGQVAVATIADLDEAAEAAWRGYKAWSKVSAFERSKILRKAGDLLRERADEIGRLMTVEHGKTLFESRFETVLGADIIDWYAEEGRRTYGRVIPARLSGVRQIVMKEPVGPVAAFTPWNFPINQAVRKIAGALAAGCSIVLKGPEETPRSCAELVRAFVDAGVPGDAINLVYGVPADISGHLIPHPLIRKITFTGSTVVGKQLAALAGAHMKRITMELGGHAPVVVMNDADIPNAVTALRSSKYRNNGQVCVSPTRFLIQDGVYDEFVSSFVSQAKQIRVGNGLEEGVDMGALANDRRLSAMEMLVADATARGGKVATGGRRIGNSGYFFEPTVLTDVPTDARIMNEEPFGPVIIANRFSEIDEAIGEANRLPYGLAAYAYTRSAKSIDTLSEAFESGMVSVNQQGLALPETPFGGVKDSGYGSEGGSEALEPFLSTKFVSQIGA
jgi:succinate-semialdehyde dehydrogenase/glutarate-semialdehyde dehydrogenase